VSAFICEDYDYKRLMATLVKTGYFGDTPNIDKVNSLIGTLYETNIEAVNALYGTKEKHPRILMTGEELSSGINVPPLEALKLADYLEYQSEDLPSFRDTLAAAAYTSIHHHLINVSSDRLPALIECDDTSRDAVFQSAMDAINKHLSVLTMTDIKAAFILARDGSLIDKDSGITALTEEDVNHHSLVLLNKIDTMISSSMEQQGNHWFYSDHRTEFSNEIFNKLKAIDEYTSAPWGAKPIENQALLVRPSF